MRVLSDCSSACSSACNRSPLTFNLFIAFLAFFFIRVRMRIFNPVGETVTTRGVVRRCWRDGDEGLVELEMRSEITRGISVGPGPVVVSLPLRSS